MRVCGDRREIPAGYFLADCAVSGGDLREFLREALAAAEGKLCCVLEPVYMDFPLPCPSGAGRPLMAGELRSLHRDQPCHFSRSLCTEYFTELRDGRLHAVLFDSPESLREKYRALEEAGIPLVLIEDRNLRRQLNG